jgi:6-phosphogluconolactonase
MSDKIIISFRTLDELYHELLKQFYSTLNQDKSSYIIISGGKTPITFYKILSKEKLDWENISFIPSDERCVRITNQLSNEGTIKSLLGRSNNYNFLSLHANDIEVKLKNIDGYDLAILGLGEDGHFASMFPNMSNLEEALNSSRILLKVFDNYPDVERLTLSLNEILKAKKIILLATNKTKINLLKKKRESPSYLPIDYLLKRAEDKISIFTTEKNKNLEYC